MTRRRCRDPYRRWTFQRRAVDGAKQLSELSASFPGALTSWGFKALASSQLLFGARRPTFNVGVSNVPGPQAPLYMNGARVERFFGVAPIFHGTALVFGVFSYRGAIDVTFVSCRRIVARPRVPRRMPPGLIRRTARHRAVTRGRDRQVPDSHTTRAVPRGQ